ncbi:PREDICTED: pyrin and HIN domain-containing protein 1-like [Dipodomys ordii]|uniref:Pyrin and HIN domain-containing protein 1-like n=1 Tax=Dipodomys ordii TaxID=10020 RepID=A0A1S3GAV3_DIPOR|nr:PREDICTED: pyrin and HIN domain-containing protein 1-like [Dipodomys ordii]
MAAEGGRRGQAPDTQEVTFIFPLKQNQSCSYRVQGLRILTLLKTSPERLINNWRDKYKNKYKKIVLLKGLEAINDYHFSLFKSLLARDLRLTRKRLVKCDRIEIADLMEDEFQNDTGVGKLIALFKEIPDLRELAETLWKEKLKAKGKTPAKKFKQGQVGCLFIPTASNTLTSEEVVGTPKPQVLKELQIHRYQGDSLAPQASSVPPSTPSAQVVKGKKKPASYFKIWKLKLRTALQINSLSSTVILLKKETCI